MPDKYSLAKCEQYGRRLAARLCQQHFGPQPEATLDGPALLKFTPLRQVNLLVLQQLLGRWQHEASALRSPYFDFEAAPVQMALSQFMNVLSRHIAVGRAALEPLLAQAVADTLLLATDPVAAFERLLLPPASTPAPEPGAAVPLPYLRERLRYLDQAKPLLEGFVDSLPTGNAPLSRDFLTQRFELYRAIHYQQVPALASLVTELSALLPLIEADLWADGPGKVAPAPTRPAPAAPAATPPHPPAVAEASASLPPTPPTAALSAARAAAAAPEAMAPSAAETVETTEAPAPANPQPPAVSMQPVAPPPALPAPAGPPVPDAEPVPAAPTPAPPPAGPVAEAPAPETAAPPAPPRPAPDLPAPAPRPVVPSFAPSAAEAPAGVPLYEKLKATQPGGAHLAETLRGTATDATPRLAERGAPRVGSLREGISINQRYSFTNELFGGEADDYNAAIEHLDQLPTAVEAQGYVQELAARHDWAGPRREEHVGRLLKLLERKFAGA